MARWDYGTYGWAAGKGFGGIFGEKGIQAMLKKRGEEGWRLVTAIPFENAEGGPSFHLRATSGD